MVKSPLKKIRLRSKSLDSLNLFYFALLFFSPLTNQSRIDRLCVKNYTSSFRKITNKKFVFVSKTFIEYPILSVEYWVMIMLQYVKSPAFEV